MPLDTFKYKNSSDEIATAVSEKIFKNLLKITPNFQKLGNFLWKDLNIRSL